MNTEEQDELIEKFFQEAKEIDVDNFQKYIYNFMSLFSLSVILITIFLNRYALEFQGLKNPGNFNNYIKFLESEEEGSETIFTDQNLKDLDKLEDKLSSLAKSGDYRDFKNSFLIKNKLIKRINKYPNIDDEIKEFNSFVNYKDIESISIDKRYEMFNKYPNINTIAKNFINVSYEYNKHSVILYTSTMFFMFLNIYYISIMINILLLTYMGREALILEGLDSRVIDILKTGSATTLSVAIIALVSVIYMVFNIW